jgi:inosine-uridine nucleoside N-ribohydrolase
MIASSSPELDLLGVIATGPRPRQRAVVVAKELALMGRQDLRVYLGDSLLPPAPHFVYWAQFPHRRWALTPHLLEWGHGFDLQAPPMSGAAFIRQSVRRYPGEVTLMLTGPPSTLGQALAEADSAGDGAEFRAAIGQVYFGGGDFHSAEYNVWRDIPAARLMLSSGARVFQFGGEDAQKLFLTYPWRERIWQAQTPATWALQDYYRLYGAGWDPTAPFVPILYDAIPVAVLIGGDRYMTFAPKRAEADSNGFLVETPGAPNLLARASNRADLTLEFAVERLTNRVWPANNHLQALERLADSLAPSITAGIRAARTALIADSAAGRAVLEQRLDSLGALVGRDSALATAGREHLELAREFLLGAPRASPWKDRYTPTFIALYVRYLTLPKWVVVAAGLLLVAGVAILLRRPWRT